MKPRNKTLEQCINEYLNGDESIYMPKLKGKFKGDMEEFKTIDKVYKKYDRDRLVYKVWHENGLYIILK